MCVTYVCACTLVIIITVNYLTSMRQRASIRISSQLYSASGYTVLRYTKFNHLSLSASQIEVPARHIIIVGSTVIINASVHAQTYVTHIMAPMHKFVHLACLLVAIPLIVSRLVQVSGVHVQYQKAVKIWGHVRSKGLFTCIRTYYTVLG